MTLGQSLSGRDCPHTPRVACVDDRPDETPTHSCVNETADFVTVRTRNFTQTSDIDILACELSTVDVHCVRAIQVLKSLREG